MNQNQELILYQKPVTGCWALSIKKYQHVLITWAKGFIMTNLAFMIAVCNKGNRIDNSCRIQAQAAKSTFPDLIQDRENE